MENNTMKTYPNVARVLMVNGMNDLVRAVKAKIDYLLSGDPKIACDDERYQALTEIKQSLFYLRRDLDWVFSPDAEDIYYTLTSLATGEYWTTNGLKAVQKVLNRYIPKVE